MSDPQTRTGMSGLYANLLEPSPSSSSSASISRAPIVFKQQSKDGADTSEPPSEDSLTAAATYSAQKKLNAAALRFQPTLKRPQQAQQIQKAKPKIVLKSTPAAAVVEGGNAAGGGSGGPARPIVKTTLDDWTGDGDDDVNGFYAANRDQARRGGRKKRKKNKDTPPLPTNWDDIYDPSRPNSYEEYKDGDEKLREMEDWRDKVLWRRRRRADSYSSNENDAPKPNISNKFAPPPQYSFAPPANQAHAAISEPVPPPPHGDQHYSPPPPSPPPPPPPPSAPVVVPDDVSGEDAYARRLRMSQIGQAGYSSTSGGPISHPFQPQPPQQFLAPHPATTAPMPTISREPIRYAFPPAAPEEDLPILEAQPEEDMSPERSLLPGQKGFATRLMSKYGWKSGSGLGAESTGIVQPLRAVASKSKDLAGRGKIIDKNKRPQDDGGRFGKTSEVIVLRGMVDGMHGEDEATILQDIGEECHSEYGHVERVFIDWGERQGGTATRVFIQFTSQLSALKAVNALQGRLFNGNIIEAKFFDKDKFETRNLD